MGHIGHEPTTPQSSTSIKLIPAASNSRPRSSESADGGQKNMETKPRFDGMRFDSPLFDLYVGPDKNHFAIHRAVLNQSPHFRSLCNAQALCRSGGAKAKYTLYLKLDNPQGMGHLLEYLYTKTFTILATDPLDEAKHLADLYLLASNYKLPRLQEAVISQLESRHISSKVTAMQFFNMAEDLYSEEPHIVMREYFARVAPGLLRTVAEEELQELLRMISEGGDFATDLFAAHHQAFGPGHLPASHPESELQDGPLHKRVKTDEPTAGPVNIRTAWDDANEIPSFWHEMTEADKLLVNMREEGKSWNEIDQALKVKHGKTGSITEWLNRYGRISINMAHMRLKKGDVDRFFAAKEQVETRFQIEKWSLIADEMEKNGADRYRADFLKKKFKDLEVALQAREKAKATSTANTGRSVHGTVSGDGDRVMPGTSNGVGNRSQNVEGATNSPSNVPESPDNIVQLRGGSGGNLPAGEKPVLDGAAARVAINRAFNPAFTEATPTARTTVSPTPQTTKKRPNTAIKDVPNSITAKPGPQTPVSDPAKAKAEKSRKTPMPKPSVGTSQKANETKRVSTQIVTVLKVPQSKAVDADYVALDDEEDDDDEMSEDDELLA